MVYVIQVCGQLASRIRMEMQFHPDLARKLLLFHTRNKHKQDTDHVQYSRGIQIGNVHR